MLDYTILRVIWWALLGFLLIAFAVMDGFDMGAALLLPWLGRNNIERRIIINSVGPVWEGNQVWLILGAGVIFAAWPLVYATAFSCLYFAMLLLLACLILRPVAFKYRGKIHHPTWRSVWDSILCLTGLLPALLFGIAVGNVLQGIPFSLDADLRINYSGSFFGLLNPFALLCGLLSLAMMTLHGSLYLSLKTINPIRERAMTTAGYAGIACLGLFALGGLWVNYKLNGYSVNTLIDTRAISNPLHKQVSIAVGAWMLNYKAYPLSLLAPALGFIGILLAIITRQHGKGRLAFCGSALGTAGIISTVGISMFPFILPSSLQPNASLTLWDASSSQMTLFMMLLVSCIFLPLIILYTSWVYRVMRGKVTPDDISNNSQNLY